MSAPVSERLQALGIELPTLSPPLGSYVPITIFGDLAWVSGQIALRNGQVVSPGRVGGTVDLAAAREAARIATLQGLGALAARLGSIDRVQRILRLVVYVAGAPGFDRPHEVANGASDLLREIFGEEGRPARVSLGVAALPLDAPVEVEMTAGIRR